MLQGINQLPFQKYSLKQSKNCNRQLFFYSIQHHCMLKLKIESLPYKAKIMSVNIETYTDFDFECSS